MPVEEEFSRALAQLWMRDGIVVDDALALATTVTAMFADGADGQRAAAALLKESGIRAQWNLTLSRDRARALASRIRPLTTEPLLDLLSGDGSICEALSELGVARLSATERSHDYAGYGDSRLPGHVQFEPFSIDLDLSRFNASTALVSTVLHHEPEPIRLLDSLARSGIPRWIVIENCITAEFTGPFHEFADRFFNTCLNDIGIHCGQEHRSLTEWSDLLKTYGTVTVVADSFSVPGIPFPYSILVVNPLGAASVRTGVKTVC
jgi:hypothetical protein